MRSFNLRGGTAVALALVVALATLCVGVATADAAPKLRSIRCASSGCHAVAPKKKVIMKGKGFTKGMQAVFTARRDGFTFQETASTRVASASRIRARVPSDAISGPTFVFVPKTGSRSNALKVRIPGRPAPKPAPAPTPTKCSSTPSSNGDAVTRWKPVVVCVLGMLHQEQTSRNQHNVYIIIRNESGGNPRATNNWDSNAANGDPSRGLMQTIGSTFNAYRSKSLPNDIYDPAANIYAGLNYGIHRYGSIERIPGVWSVNHGGGYRPYRQVADQP